MPKRTLDPKIAEVLKEHGFGKDSVWDCHGTWVIYHNVLEQIAAKVGISFTPPSIIEASALDKVAVITVQGIMGSKSEWSFGEAAPYNNKNTYPYAMAEKRAKDRVILKLIGLHGLAYSEEEADDFKRQTTDTDPRETDKIPKGKVTEYKQFVEETIKGDLADAGTGVAVDRIRRWYREEWQHKFNDTFNEKMNHLIDERENMISDDAPDEKTVYCTMASETISNWQGDWATLLRWWNDEAKSRRQYNLHNNDVLDLKEQMELKRAEINEREANLRDQGAERADAGNGSGQGGVRQAPTGVESAGQDDAPPIDAA